MEEVLLGFCLLCIAFICKAETHKIKAFLIQSTAIGSPQIFLLFRRGRVGGACAFFVELVFYKENLNSTRKIGEVQSTRVSKRDFVKLVKTLF